MFGARRVWIDPSEFRQILRDDGYRIITEPLLPGDVVLYGRSSDGVDHVGMVHLRSLVLPPAQPEPEVWVRSKWGDGGEYVHKIDDVPTLLGKPREYWRFR